MDFRISHTFMLGRTRALNRYRSGSINSSYGQWKGLKANEFWPYAHRWRRCRHYPEPFGFGRSGGASSDGDECGASPLEERPLGGVLAAGDRGVISEPSIGHPAHAAQEVRADRV